MYYIVKADVIVGYTPTVLPSYTKLNFNLTFIWRLAMSIISKKEIEKLSIEELKLYIEDIKKQMIWRENQPYVKTHGLGDSHDIFKELLKICQQILKEKQMPNSAQIKFNNRNFLLAIEHANDAIGNIFFFINDVYDEKIELTKEVKKPLKAFSEDLKIYADKFPHLINKINKKLNK